MRTRAKTPVNQDEINLIQFITVMLLVLLVLIVKTYDLMPHVHPPGSYTETPTVNILLTSK
jgi:biopolymer transport protein ExbD